LSVYDQVPYASYCYPETDLGRILAVASLFKSQKVAPSELSVLEIGCATGANLLPMALRYPKATFLGLELSHSQVGLANQAKEILDIANVSFEAISILDKTLAEQKFDIIIANQFYSYVSQESRDRLFDICKSNLAQNGVALVTYNTMPGWHVNQTVRDMMMFHSSQFESPADKVRESRNMLQFVINNLMSPKSVYSDLLTEQNVQLSDVDNNYLFHEYIDGLNEPCYFHEFMTAANAFGLNYLADMDLPTMFIGNQSAEAQETLKALPNIIQQEQYVDFLSNRRYRRTLLVKEEAPITRALASLDLPEIYLDPKYAIAASASVSNLDSIESLDLVDIYGSGATITLTGEIPSLCYLALARNHPMPMTNSEICDAVCRMKPDLDKDAVTGSWNVLSLEYLFRGLVNISTHKPDLVTKVSTYPNVFQPAVEQAKTNAKVPNIKHQMIELSGEQRVILQLANGKNTIDEIIIAVKKSIDQGEMAIALDGNKIEASSDRFDDAIGKYISAQLNYFLVNSLLVN
jgi:methyltransferase-like protein/cyclopropane fatty-acyl-phospholipid synthase-like methyltransferase